MRSQAVSSHMVGQCKTYYKLPASVQARDPVLLPARRILVGHVAYGKLAISHPRPCKQTLLAPAEEFLEHVGGCFP